MYFVDVSSEAPTVLKILISYVFQILLYTYVCTKYTKLFIHVPEYVFFVNTSKKTTYLNEKYF